MDASELHRRAVAEFAARVDGIDSAGSGAWSAQTPCTEWTVRALVNHLTYEDRWTTPMLAGATVAEVGDRFEGDLLRDDPVGAFATASREATDAAAQTDPSQIVHLSFGDFPAREYLYQLAADHLIHAWDLAAATDGDRQLDPEVVAGIADWYADREADYRAGGFVGPRVAVSSDDPQDRLLGGFGRDPAWRSR
ncbi:MAG TPA: TIGR03086 family metal-binding protein [Micromonosporaceae bacterium]|nr:TIGR03086 family metal-binding protein [Micromonosporaceae bacterium]